MLPNTYFESNQVTFENWQTMINQHSKFLMFFAKFKMDEMNIFIFLVDNVVKVEDFHDILIRILPVLDTDKRF